MSLEAIWIGVGFLGQVCFFMRFFIQWIISEKREESVIPEIFWYFSIGGAALLLSYAIWRRDPVFIVGQSFGFIVYLRNLILINRKKKELPAK